MNKFFKVSLIVLGIIIVVAVGIYVKLFYIGNSDYQSIVINRTSIGNSSIVISGDFTDSGKAYKNFSYTLVGRELYVTINSVLSSNKYKSGSFVIEIPISGNSVDNIHLTDNKSTKVIYQK